MSSLASIKRQRMAVEGRATVKGTHGYMTPEEHEETVRARAERLKLAHGSGSGARPATEAEVEAFEAHWEPRWVGLCERVRKGTVACSIAPLRNAAQADMEVVLHKKLSRGEVASWLRCEWEAAITRADEAGLRALRRYFSRLMAGVATEQEPSERGEA